jgi:hypothetical protein
MSYSVAVSNPVTDTEDTTVTDRLRSVMLPRNVQARMVTRQQRSVTWWRDVGAGVVTAAAALAASLLYLLVAMVVPLRLSPDAQYWAGHAPQFAFVAGFVLGAIVWRRVVSRVSTPKHGAFVGSAMALGIVAFVPILAGVYVLLFPLPLSIVTRQGLHYAIQLYPEPLWTAVDVTRTVATAWSPLVGALLVPLGAVAGWASQRRRRLSRH